MIQKLISSIRNVSHEVKHTKILINNQTMGKKKSKKDIGDVANELPKLNQNNPNAANDGVPREIPIAARAKGDNQKK